MRRRNTQMKHKVLAGLLLGCLFVMIALGYSPARVILATAGQEGKKNELDVTGITAMFVQKEPIDRTGAAHMRKLGLKGKKLMAHEEASMESKYDKGAHGRGTSKFSGKDKDALEKSIRSPRELKNDQKKHMTMIAPRASKFTNFVIPRGTLSNTNSKCSQDTNPGPVKASSTSSSRPEGRISEEPQGTTQKDENQSLHDAAKEIMNLIQRDYGRSARRKPPINNHEPRN